MMVRYRIDPRMIPPAKAARRLHISESEFAQKRAELEAAGFPKPDPILGNYCLEAVDNWINDRAGLHSDDDPVSAQTAMLRAVREQRWAE